VNLDEIAARLPRTPHPEVVSLYAQLIGEFMFIAINTQPLIAQPGNALARFMTTANSELYVLAQGVLRYLKGVKSRKIVWCASRVKFPFVPCEIYAYSDASSRFFSRCRRWFTLPPRCRWGWSDGQVPHLCANNGDAGGVERDASCTVVGPFRHGQDVHFEQRRTSRGSP
jgi:hypothetical protein